ncbi:hypothetical protein ACFXKW_19350 [Streptomyces sp. NPDC059193]|uniref:hypothetical protein n=1 Tax=Streptomyces sp. NPDC059193 TaxID=3346763 RepID=UPI003698450E
MSEQGTAGPKAAEPETVKPGTVKPGTAEPEVAGRPDEFGLADNLAALVLLAPALALLRFLGEHGWAYWTAVVLGGLGVLAAALGIAAAVRSLRRGRRRLLAVYTIVLLLVSCFLLVVRLVES